MVASVCLYEYIVGFNQVAICSYMFEVSKGEEEGFPRINPLYTVLFIRTSKNQLSLKCC